MKHIKKIFAIALAAVMLLSCVPSAFAATSETAAIDMDADCSLTIYAFDWTNAYKDGVAGGTLMLAAVLVILFAFKKKEDQQTVQQ